MLLSPSSLSYILCLKFTFFINFCFTYNLNPSQVVSINIHQIYSMKQRTSALLKQEFLKNWIKGLRIYSNFNKEEMTILERKNAIKLSADVAIASTRTVATHWSQALVADVSAGGGAAKIVVEQILGRKVIGKKAASTVTCSKKIVRRSHWRRVVRSRDVKASSIAKKLVKNRTRVLKRLVPGGEDMDEVLLIKETLDYIASLQLQVDVMRHLAAAAAAAAGETLDPQQR